MRIHLRFQSVYPSSNVLPQISDVLHCGLVRITLVHHDFHKVTKAEDPFCAMLCCENRVDEIHNTKDIYAHVAEETAGLRISKDLQELFLCDSDLLIALLESQREALFGKIAVHTSRGEVDVVHVAILYPDFPSADLILHIDTPGLELAQLLGHHSAPIRLPHDTKYLLAAWLDDSVDDVLQALFHKDDGQLFVLRGRHSAHHLAEHADQHVQYREGSHEDEHVEERDQDVHAFIHACGHKVCRAIMQHSIENQPMRRTHDAWKKFFADCAVCCQLPE
mmetsp:Transcript_114998/g.211480  ORF Transcript_114998/g.211480 Transcript_114998/m.211480 type:complete len:278 (-) Transcript_114998:915-1748(-)